MAFKMKMSFSHALVKYIYYGHVTKGLGWFLEKTYCLGYYSGLYFVIESRHLNWQHLIWGIYFLVQIFDLTFVVCMFGCWFHNLTGFGPEEWCLDFSLGGITSFRTQTLVCPRSEVMFGTLSSGSRNSLDRFNGRVMG